MKYEPPKTPAAHIPTHMVAPHGWDIVGRVGVAMQPAQPYVEIMGHYFVPAKPKPRTWVGTIRTLADDSTADVWGWGDDVQIVIEEVLK